MDVNPCGVLGFLHWNHDWNHYHFSDDILPKAIDQISELGVGLLRMDILWSDVLQKNGQFDFSRYDKILSLLEKKEIEILALLQYNKQRTDEKGKLVWNHPPQDLDEFIAYVETTVTRYKSLIHHWEIWNEPNHSVFWAKPMDELKTYGKMLRRSYQTAKKIDPTCTVLNGGLTFPLLPDVENFYKQGLKEFTDIFNFHVFLDPLAPDRLKKFETLIMDVSNIMKKYGDQDKKMWITEIGCPGIPASRPLEKWFGGEGVREKEQARWLKEIFTLQKKFPALEKIVWAFYRDTLDEFDDSTNHFGVVDINLNPKPSFHTLKEIVKEYAKEFA